ncbi:MAG: phosphotriesterase family protein [Syntrophomonadales bacterium]
MSKMVNTVTGPVSSDSLGKTYIHEHLLFGYPGFQGDFTVAPFNREEALKACVDTIKPLVEQYGLKTVVDATPNDCGRDVLFMKEVSEKTGLNIIASCGYYYEGEGSPAYFKQRLRRKDIVPDIYEMMKMETTVGIEGTGIKAGVFKLASSKDVITDYEKAFFVAAAKVSSEEGIPIITHTQEGTMGPEQADLLIASGADPKRINIGHMGGNTDIQYHLNTLEKGVYISFDRFGLQKLAGCPMDSTREMVIAALCAAGYADRIMLSHDAIIVWKGRTLALPDAAKPLVADWHWGHILKDVVPDLKKLGVSDEQIDMMLVENPKRFFGY